MNLSGAFESQLNVHKELFALDCYEFIISSVVYDDVIKLYFKKVAGNERRELPHDLSNHNNVAKCVPYNIAEPFQSARPNHVYIFIQYVHTVIIRCITNIY
jgi:hypothetical protein